MTRPALTVDQVAALKYTAAYAVALTLLGHAFFGGSIWPVALGAGIGSLSLYPAMLGLLQSRAAEKARRDAVAAWHQELEWRRK